LRDDAAVTVRAVDLGSPTDAAALLDLLDHYACDPMGGGTPLAARVRAVLIERLCSEAGYLGGIAWQGTQAVGLVNCFRGFSTFAAQPLLNIHDLVVRDGFRGQGVGAALLAWAEGAARDLGCCKLTLEVLGANVTAMDSYRRAGFRPYQLDPAAGQAVLLQKPL
jgi:GNAT superfamily N-acetyltransferase